MNINANILKKSVVWYTAATILQKGVAFLTTPVYTRILSDSQYGMYSVYQSWLQIVSIVSVVALDRCITVGFMKFDSDRKGFLSSIQCLMSLTVTLSCIVLIIWPDFFGKLLGFSVPMMLLMLIVSLLSNALSNWSWYQRYECHYKKLAICTVIFTAVIQSVSVTAIVFAPFGDKGELLIFASSIATIVLYGIVYVIVFLKGKVFVSKTYWSFALPYSTAMVPHALAQIILNSSDRIMIDKLCGRSDAAYYGITYSAAMLLNIIMLSVSSSIQPWFFEKIKCGNFKSIRKMTNCFLLLPAALSFIVSLLAPEILALLAPPSYQAALWVFPSVAASVFFNCLYLCFANFESYYEKPFYFSIATITGAAVNIALNFIFIPLLGFIAAGYTTLVCYMLFAVMHYVFMRRVCKKELHDVKVFDMKFIVVLSFLVFTISVVVSFTYMLPYLRYVLIVFIMLVCVMKRKSIINNIKSM